MRAHSIWVDEFANLGDPAFDRLARMMHCEEARLQEAFLLDLVLAALCGPFGRVRLELVVPYERRLEARVGELSGYYP